MDASLPTAKNTHSTDERPKLKRIIVERGLCGLANDTKWDEFISEVRSREGWRPSYRCKCIDAPPSYWDTEWFYHLPFPMLSVEWLDIAFIQQTHQHEDRGRLIAPFTTDHSPWLEKLLRGVGLEYQKGSTMIRIFGYSPKSLDLFDV